MNLEQVVKSRRSIRKFQDREVPLGLIMKAIELAGWAPNGGNFQSWRFFVVRNRDLISRMADAVQAKNDLIASWPEAEPFGDTFQRYRRNCSFFRSAPAVIAVGHGDYQSPADKVLRQRGQSDPAAAEMIANRAAAGSRTQTVAGATATLLLALSSLGLGACWMAGPMLAKREIEEMLDVPAGISLFSLVPVGFSAEDPTPGPRKPLEEIVRVID